MKIAALTVAFREAAFIRANVRQFKPFNIDHLVLNSSVPWRGTYITDNTEELAKSEGALVRTGVWENQAEQFNEGLDILKDYDWVLIVDADEFYERKNILRLKNKLEETKADAITTPIMEVYWKNFNYRIVPTQSDGPIIAIKPNQKFTNKRSSDCIKESFPLKMHHLSYVRSNKDMMKKITVFEHSYEFDVVKWYYDVWLKWDTSMVNLHPVVPHQFQRAVYDPLPKEIRELFNV